MGAVYTDRVAGDIRKGSSAVGAGDMKDIEGCSDRNIRKGVLLQHNYGALVWGHCFVLMALCCCALLFFFLANGGLIQPALYDTNDSNNERP
jgi:hypothetical protein